ncbi:MAG: hypothetical protein IJ594_04825 [Oscillospiraceae bacterium]|nr:hypothetical protein [Oscillospiraceae bacterium]
MEENKRKAASLPRRAWRRLKRLLADPRGEQRNFRYYRKLVKLVPELGSYNWTGAMDHLAKRAQELGCGDLGAYYRLLRDDEQELTRLQSNFTLKGSHFFRGDDWDFFGERCLPELKDREKLRVWCAGCSSGQEAWSLIMALLDHVPLERIEVLATDYNDELLDKCRAGAYFNMHLHEVPERYRRYIDYGPKRFTIKPELRSVVRVENLNLLTDPYPAGFDVILCRNVLKFFSAEVIARLQKRLAASLTPGGYLFLSEDDGHRSAERIEKPAQLGLEEIDGRCIYRRLT